MINVFFKTYGCQANAADSQSLINFLTDFGCNIVQNRKDADLVIINTCSIREKAELKVFSYLGEFAKLKKEKPYLKIGVIGCMASYRKDDIFKRFDYVNFVFGSRDNLVDLQKYLADLIVKLQTTKQLYFENSDKEIDFGRQDRNLSAYLSNGTKKLNLGGFKSDNKQAKQSFINIMTGCNNYCSYCIVPFVRGREKSYPMIDILNRIKRDVQNGAKDITLIGQNVNSYKDPQTGAGFAQLLENVAQIEGDFWVKFISPHPKDMTIDVVDMMVKYTGKLCHFVHHPLQSGSNEILKAMNRTYTVEQYMEQIGWIKEKLPNTTISTDIIVGFPGETEQDYLQTRKVMQDVEYDLVYSFIYSPRKYTKAALLKDDCSADVKLARLEDLQKWQTDICKKRNLLNIGKTLKTLVEKRLSNGKLLARTEGFLRVLFDGEDDLIGKFVYLNIKDAGSVNLIGTLK